MKSSSGISGCLKCLHKGQSVPYGNGHHVIYSPYIILWKPLRNKKNYLQHLAKTNSSKKIFEGVKGNCLLSKLKFYDIIRSSNIDMMHSIFLGVMKTLFKYWFSSTLDRPYCLKSSIDLINKKLLECRPPNSVAQTPRLVQDYGNWRAHEFLNFLLFFSLPVFKETMTSKYFNHFLLLIISLEKLLSKKIKRIELNLINSMLIKFVVEADILYDKDICTSGFHELTHLVSCTFELGPMNDVCCFAFEELNRKITRSIKGHDLVGAEFLKLWSVSLIFSLKINSYTEENQFVTFMRDYFSIKSSNLKMNNNGKVFLRLGKVINLDMNTINKPLRINIHKLVGEEEVYFYDRIHMNKILYTRGNNESKFNNSVVRLDEKIGIIEFICKSKDSIFLIARNTRKKSSNFFNDFFKETPSFFSEFYIMNSFFFIQHTEIHQLKKLFLFYHEKSDQSLCLISNLSTNHLFS